MARATAGHRGGTQKHHRTAHNGHNNCSAHQPSDLWGTGKYVITIARLFLAPDSRLEFHNAQVHCGKGAVGSF